MMSPRGDGRGSRAPDSGGGVAVGGVGITLKAPGYVASVVAGDPGVPV